MEEAFKLGAEAYVTKPFDMDLPHTDTEHPEKIKKSPKKHAHHRYTGREREALFLLTSIYYTTRPYYQRKHRKRRDGCQIIARQMGMSRARYNKTKRMMKQVSTNTFIMPHGACFQRLY